MQNGGFDNAVTQGRKNHLLDGGLKDPIAQAARDDDDLAPTASFGLMCFQ